MVCDLSSQLLCVLVMVGVWEGLAPLVYCSMGWEGMSWRLTFCLSQWKLWLLHMSLFYRERLEDRFRIFVATAQEFIDEGC